MAHLLDVPLVDGLDGLFDGFFSGTSTVSSGTLVARQEDGDNSSGTGWRLEFVIERSSSGTVARGRLRRGRGKNRRNIVRPDGTIVRNFVPLGKIEDIERDYPQWHARCAAFRRATGYNGTVVQRTTGGKETE